MTSALGMYHHLVADWLPHHIYGLGDIRQFDAYHDFTDIRLRIGHILHLPICCNPSVRLQASLSPLNPTFPI